MYQNIFRIYDGRTGFLQWDTKQKLIVLDDSITEVHFSNKNMNHSIKENVYLDGDDIRVCDVPDYLLQLPINLIATAYTNDNEEYVKCVKFAVQKRPIPMDYVEEPDGVSEDIIIRLDRVEKKKVDKVDGKDLSTNDLTNELKENYDYSYDHSISTHAPTNAQENVIEKITINNVEKEILNKTVNIFSY